MDLSRVSIEDLKKELDRRKKVEKALKETFDSFGMFGCSDELSTGIANNKMSSEDMLCLVYQLRYHLTDSASFDGVETKEFDEYDIEVYPKGDDDKYRIIEKE